MGWMKVRRGLAVGQLRIGADVDLTRGAANRLDLADGFQVSGTVNVTGAARIAGIATLAGGMAAAGSVGIAGSVIASGTPFILPNGTAAITALRTNGAVYINHYAHVPYLCFQSNGTPYALAMPTTTHGTVTCLANAYPT